MKPSESETGYRTSRGLRSKGPRSNQMVAAEDIPWCHRVADGDGSGLTPPNGRKWCRRGRGRRGAWGLRPLDGTMPAIPIVRGHETNRTSVNSAFLSRFTNDERFWMGSGVEPIPDSGTKWVKWRSHDRRNASHAAVAGEALWPDFHPERVFPAIGRLQTQLPAFRIPCVRDHERDVARCDLWDASKSVREVCVPGGRRGCSPVPQIRAGIRRCPVRCSRIACGDEPGGSGNIRDRDVAAGDLVLKSVLPDVADEPGESPGLGSTARIRFPCATMGVRGHRGWRLH